MTWSHFDIVWTDLNPTKGAETRKERPCVIIQSDMMNAGSRTFIVAPLLPDHKPWPFVVNLAPTAQNRLDKPRHLNAKQIRAVDKTRFSNKHGKLEHKYLAELQSALSMILNIGDIYE